MTEQEKQILLVDLCARLPYGVIVQIDFGEHCSKYGIDRYVDDTVICVYPETFEVGVNDEDQACDIEDIKPYLRSTSSMTEEERNEYFLLKHRDNDRDDNIILLDEASTLIDWLNAHHFDYRGLIPMGLALEAPEEMYNTKQ